MSGIFLSYRRDDASGWAGRLYEHLVRDRGSGQVFMDIDTIAPGEDFREAIDRTMRTCGVVLVIIGPNWVDVRDQAGNRRLDDEGDTHRAELSAALAAPGMRVVPVLVGGASMPKAADLPEPLRDLAYRNAAVIEDRRFASDVGALQKTLQPFAQDSAAAGHGPSRPGSPAASLPTMLALAGMLLVLVWAVLVPRSWHNEVWWVRAGAGTLVVVVAGVGLWTRQWTWVLAAGVAGVAGVALWMLMLVSTHTDELNEIVSPGADGIQNAVTLLGVLLVVAAGWAGIRGRPSGAGHERA